MRSPGAVQELIHQLKVRAIDLLPTFRAGRPLWVDFDVARALREGLRGSPYVYICVMRNANAIGSIPMLVERFDGTDDRGLERWSRVPSDHALQAILNRPNDIYGRQAFNTLVAMEMFVSGNSVLCLFRSPSTNEVLEIWTLPPDRVRPIPSKSITVEAYEVTRDDGTKLIIPSEDTVHIQFPCPGRPWWGLAPLESAMPAVDVDRKAAEWQATTLDNLMVPVGVFKVNQHMTTDQFDDFQDDMQEEYAGAANARRPLAIGRDVDWIQLGMTPEEVGFLESRQFTREEICSIFGVPLPVAGILTDATYSNIETARRIWWEDTLLPFLGLVVDSYNAQLVPNFQQDGERLRVIADTSKVHALRETLEAQTRIAREWFDMGVPLNQLIEELHIPLSQVEVATVPVEDTEEDAIERMSRGFERLRRAFDRIDKGFDEQLENNIVPIKREDAS